MDPKELRKLTDEAVKRGAQYKREVADRNLAESDRQRKADELKAQSILAEAPDRAEEAARKGLSEAVVMTLRYDDYDQRGQNWNVLMPDQLKRVARLVYEGCVAAGFKTTLEFGHDGGGMESWFNIMISW